MPSSSKLVKPDAKVERVLEYQLPKLDMGISDKASDFYAHQREKPNGFRMSEVQKIKSGVNKIEEVILEELVEAKVLERIKEVQEPAYQEAYQLGLVEGKKEAYSKMSTEITHRLEDLSQLTQSIVSLKKDLLKHNETHLVKLLLHIAAKLAFHEVQSNPEALVGLLQQAVESAQGEQALSVRVHPEQLAFLDSLKAETSHDLEFAKRAKWIPDENLKLGECIIETNYGEIDGRFEERIERIWASFSDIMFTVKDQSTSKAG